jgi:hypothetical protein
MRRRSNRSTEVTPAQPLHTGFSQSRRAFLLAGAAVFLAGCSGVHAQNAAFGTRRYLGGGMPYEAFDELPSSTVEVHGGSMQVAFAPGEFALSEAKILDWIESSADTVALYYGRFPVQHARLLVLPTAGSGVRSGNAFAYGGAAIRLRVGLQTSQAQLDRDWVLVHEMVHLAFPSVNRRHHWIEEGLATYVEGVARAQAGRLSADRVWAGYIDGMPHGLPQAGDRGLDNTPTWGRTYWGGAMFCLLADVQIRSRTHNRIGLQDALRGILAAGGNMEQDWPLTKAFEVGDAATGVPVLMTLYNEMKDQPMPVDLPKLWRRLGVSVHGRRVVYHDDAPLAAIRRAITSAPHVS